MAAYIRSSFRLLLRLQRITVGFGGKSYAKAGGRTIGSAGRREISLQFDLAQSGFAGSGACCGLSYP
jgi:hypothetical protein